MFRWNVLRHASSQPVHIVPAGLLRTVCLVETVCLRAGLVRTYNVWHVQIFSFMSLACIACTRGLQRVPSACWPMLRRCSPSALHVLSTNYGKESKLCLRMGTNQLPHFHQCSALNWADAFMHDCHALSKTLWSSSLCSSACAVCAGQQLHTAPPAPTTDLLNCYLHVDPPDVVHQPTAAHHSTATWAQRRQHPGGRV